MFSEVLSTANAIILLHSLDIVVGKSNTILSNSKYEY